MGDLYTQATEALVHGSLEDAISGYRQALVESPSHPAARGMLGVALIQAGRLEEGASELGHAAALAAVSEFCVLVGSSYQDVAQPALAEHWFRRAAEAAPDSSIPLSHLANLMRAKGDWDHAATHARQALALDTNDALAHQVLANAAAASGHVEQAEQHWNQARALEPSDPQLLRELGVFYRAQRRFAESVEALTASLSLEPESIATLHELGTTLHQQGDALASLPYFEQTLALAPGEPSLLTNYAVVLTDVGRLDEAEGAIREAIAKRPASADAWNTLGTILDRRQACDDALVAYRKAVTLAPDHMTARSNLIFGMDLREQRDTCVAERRSYGYQAAKLWPPTFEHTNDRDAARPLRVGYVSADFRHHSASRIFKAIVLGHNPLAVNATLYSSTRSRDQETDEYQRSTARFVDCMHLTDEALSALICRDQIDILVDLSGHSRGARLGVFARRSAPIQVTAWGHALGTGLPTMDHFFADPVSVPPEEESDFVENVVHLPALLCFAPPTVDVPVGPLPCLSGRPFTFGCFNRIEKVSPEAVRLWSLALHAVEGSQFMLKGVGLEAPAQQTLIRDLFAREGVSASRLVLRGTTSQAVHWAAFGEVDLGLEPVPHGGGTSTLESFWMGVPIVTLVGRGITRRQGAAFCGAAGLNEFIAHNEADYARVATYWASRPTALATVRANLRGTLLASPLCDAEGYVQAVEERYRWMWHRWLEAHAAGTASPILAFAVFLAHTYCTLNTI